MSEAVSPYECQRHRQTDHSHYSQSRGLSLSLCACLSFCILTPPSLHRSSCTRSLSGTTRRMGVWNLGGSGSKTATTLTFITREARFLLLKRLFAVVYLIRTVLDTGSMYCCIKSKWQSLFASHSPSPVSNPSPRRHPSLSSLSSFLFSNLNIQNISTSEDTPAPAVPYSRYLR